MSIFSNLKELQKARQQKNEENKKQKEFNEALLMEQEILIQSGDCEDILNFVKENSNWKGLEFDNLQKALSINPSAEVVYAFAKEIKGANVEELQKYIYKDNSTASKVVDDKKDVQFLDYTKASVVGLEFIKNVPGADIELANKEFYNVVKKVQYPSEDLVNLMTEYCKVPGFDSTKYTDYLVNLVKNRIEYIYPMLEKFAIEVKSADVAKIFQTFLDNRDSKYLTNIANARLDHKDSIQKALKDHRFM